MASAFSKDELRKEIKGKNLKSTWQKGKVKFKKALPEENSKNAGKTFVFIIICYWNFSAILQHADLEKTSSKEVRSQLGKKLDCDFKNRKAEIDKLVMEIVNAMNNTESEEESSEDEKPVKSRSSSSKKRKGDSSEESDPKPSKSKSKKRKSSESSEDWEKQKKKKVVAPVGPKKRGKASSCYSLFI